MYYSATTNCCFTMIGIFLTIFVTNVSLLMTCCKPTGVWWFTTLTECYCMRSHRMPQLMLYYLL